MGRDHKKTNSAQSSRSQDESEVEEREGAHSDQEVEGGAEDYQAEATDGEPIDGTQEAVAATAEETPSWGFEEKKKRFSKEVLIAFVAIVLLVGVFGFFAWKMFRKPSIDSDADAVASTDATNKKDEVAQQDPFVDPPAGDLAGNSKPEVVESPVVASLGDPIPAQQEPATDPFPEKQEKVNDQFADNSSRPMGLMDRNSEPARSFNELPAQVESMPAVEEKATIEIAEKSDVLHPNTKHESTDNLFGGPPPARAQREPSIDTNRFAVEEPIENRQPRPMVESVDETIRRAPVTTRVEEPRTLEPMQTEEFYVVKEGDTFWDISKQLYGTHGLFLALYEYNREISPKADLLKPGMKLRTPSCEVLKVMAAKVTDGLPERPVGRIVAADGRAAVTRVGRNEARASGIFETEKGLKVYRVGEGDTLIKIAVHHLGRAERWKQIYNMNRDQLKSEQDLQIGAELRLPADASTEPLVSAVASGR